MRTFIFRATTNSREFKLKNLYNCVSLYANIDKIMYYPNHDNDYAYIYVKRWKKHSTDLVKNIYLNKEAIININMQGKYWIFTPIETDPQSSLLVSAKLASIKGFRSLAISICYRTLINQTNKVGPIDNLDYCSQHDLLRQTSKVELIDNLNYLSQNKNSPISNYV